MSFSERLRAVLKDKSLKVTDFSKLTGIPYSTCQSYLSGTRDPGMEVLTVIYLQLYVNLNWLLTGQGEMFIGSGGGEYLTPREAALLDNYRAASEDAKRALEMSALAFASGISQPVKKAKKAEKGMVQSGSHNVQIGGNVYKK